MSTSDATSTNGQEATATAEATPIVSPGYFCWWDLGTTDLNAAKTFYTSLFGWTYEDMPLGHGDEVYTMFSYNGKQVCGGANLMPEQQSQGVPPHWSSYVLVDSADDAVAKVTQAGGTVLFPPMDIFESGRMSMFMDPTGAVLGVWQAKNHVGALHINDVGGVCWTELMTKDAAAATPFYTSVFDWKPEVQDMGGMQYTLWKGSTPSTVGGMMQITPDMGEVPSHWMLYFTVADCDASVVQAQGLGATVVVPPNDIPNVGRFSMLKDPQGAHFSIIKIVM